MTETAHKALALLATEWFKCARRSVRLAMETAPTRFERERSQIAYSSQLVQDTLSAHGMRIQDFAGTPYSTSLPAEPVNPEDFDTEEGLVVSETVEPTILHDGRIVMRGKIVLGRAQ